MKKSVGLLLFWIPLNRDKTKSYPQLFDYEEPRICLVEQYHSSWSLPKGTIKEDENFINALEREVKEETGLDKEDYTVAEGRTREDGQYEDWLISETVNRKAIGGEAIKKKITFFVGVTNVGVDEMYEKNDKALEDMALSNLGKTPEITKVKWVNFKEAKKKLPKKDYKAVKRLLKRYACDLMLGQFQDSIIIPRS